MRTHWTDETAVLFVQPAPAGDYYIITEGEEKFDILANFVADTHEERIKLLLIEARIASWVKGGKVVSDKGKKTEGGRETWYR